MPDAKELREELEDSTARPDAQAKAMTLIALEIGEVRKAMYEVRDAMKFIEGRVRASSIF